MLVQDSKRVPVQKELDRSFDRSFRILDKIILRGVLLRLRWRICMGLQKLSLIPRGTKFVKTVWVQGDRLPRARFVQKKSEIEI